jgi:hypothetical protein
MAGYQEAAYAAAYGCRGIWGASLAMNKPRAALKHEVHQVIGGDLIKIVATKEAGCDVDLKSVVKDELKRLKNEATSRN